jgi:RimJ/RimL family protein N-acetyltransferase
MAFQNNRSGTGVPWTLKNAQENGRLEAAINLDNKKSIRLVKAIGRRREGIKKRYWFEHGKWVDHLIYVANPEDIGLKASKPII